MQESDFPEMEADDISKLVDFADLSDLENMNNMDVFGELGDVSDLGDIPDLSADVTLGEESFEDLNMEEAPEELPDISLDDMLSEDAMEEMDLGDLLGGDLDISLDESAPEDTTEEMDLGDLLGDNPDISLDESAPEEALEELDLGEMSGTAPDLFMDESAEEIALGESDMGEMSGTAPDLFMDEPAQVAFGETFEDDGEISMDNLPEEDASDDLHIDDVSGGESLDDLSIDELTGGDAMPELGLEESGADALPEGMSLEEPSATDVMSDMALDDLNITEDGLLENLDIDFGALEESVGEEDSEEGELGNMLDGLLDDLDMNGTIEEEPAQEEGESQDDVADLLGLDDSFFDGEGESASGEDDLSMDMLNASDMIPEETPEAEKKPGFFKRVFGNVVTDEIAEKEREAAKLAQEEAEKQAEEDAKAKEEKDALKAEKKAEKEAKAAAKKKEKEALKAEKAKQKAEKKAKEEEEAAAELEIVGKLNKVGVCIIVIATILFLTVEIAGTNMFSYAKTKREAKNYFEMGKYTEAYMAAVGTDMKEKDSEEYDKIKTVMKVQQCLNAYQNYDRVQYYPEALDALLRGVKRYDANLEQATQLEVEKDLMSCRTQIISLLKSEFNITEARAYSMLALDKEAYQDEVVKIGVEKAR